MGFKDLRARYEALNPATQKKLAQGLVAIILALITIAVATVGGHKDTGAASNKKTQDQVEDLQPHLSYLEKSLYYETTNKVKDLDTRLKTLSLQVRAFNNRLKQQKDQKIEELQKEIDILKAARGQAPISQNATAGKTGWGVPPPPANKNGQPASFNSSNSSSYRSRPVFQPIGGFGHATQTSLTSAPEGRQPQAPAPAGGQEEGARSVYLPPSFMSADLISGFDAPTMEAAKSEPVRVLLRIKDLAVLPNDVKGDLQGCFVIAEGYGNLADERAHLRLLRLSCVARDGTSVIDAPVTGFVVDSDGRIGLRGRVVSKMGAFLARSLVAGFLQGFGQAYSESGQNLMTTASGQFQTVQPGQAFKSGIGSGINTGAQAISKFYLNMARQTFPVIEVGAGKKVTLVIEQGVNLEIHKRCLGGRDGCWKERGSSVSAVSALNNI